jgi:hypothetical protein
LDAGYDPGMKQRLLAALLACTLSLASPVVTRASSDDEEKPKIDARLEGYKDGSNMGLKVASGTALTWVLLLVLTALCGGVLFISSKRTHLD